MEQALQSRSVYVHHTSSVIKGYVLLLSISLFTLTFCVRSLFCIVAKFVYNSNQNTIAVDRYLFRNEFCVNFLITLFSPITNKLSESNFTNKKLQQWA